MVLDKHNDGGDAQCLMRDYVSGNLSVLKNACFLLQHHVGH